MKGLVVKSVASFFYVEADGTDYVCRSSTKLKRYKEKILPGDVVEFDAERLYITEIEPRTNVLKRPMIANVEYAILVFSFAEPAMNFNLLDKLLATMEYNNLETMILCTKLDLAEKELRDELITKMNYYSAIGYEVLYNSDITNKSAFVDFLVPGGKYVITGQSGVGKSTFLNKILGLDIPTQEISQALGRGKHTTRETTFYNIGDEIYLVDTPGFSSLEVDIPKDILRDLFVEFVPVSRNCKFNTCLHNHEPGCAVKKSVKDGIIMMSRYENYIKFLEEE